MVPFSVILLVFSVVIYFLLERTKEVKEEMINETLDRGDEDEAEMIEDMSEEEIIDNYEERF